MALPSLKQLRYFITVAEELNFRRAAEVLNMSQPPLTQQIKALEIEVGLDLFQRAGRRIQLTEAGETLVKEARAVVERAEGFVKTASDMKDGRLGRLRMGFTMSAPLLQWFGRSIHEFSRLYPHVLIEWNQTTANEALAALEGRTIDLALVRVPPNIRLPTYLKSDRVAEDHLMVVISQNHPLAAKRSIDLREIIDERFFCYRQQQGTTVLTQISSLWTYLGARPTLLQETDGPTTIMGLIGQGLGVSILPSSLTAIHMDGVVWREIEAAPEFTRSIIQAVYRKSGENDLMIRRYMDVLLPAAYAAESAAPSPI